MRKTMKALALFLALGATSQTIKVYAFDSQVSSLTTENEEYKITRLMEFRKEIELRGETVLLDPSVQSEFPEIKKSSDLKESLAHHMMKYMDSMCAAATMSRIVNSFQTKSLTTQSCGGQPGI